MPINVMAFTRVELSEAGTGGYIALSETGSPGNDIHTATAGTLGFDESWLWCGNTSQDYRYVTVEYGSTGSDYTVSKGIPPNRGLVTVIPGLILNNAKVIRAYGSGTGLYISGFVNRLTPGS